MLYKSVITILEIKYYPQKLQDMKLIPTTTIKLIISVIVLSTIRQFVTANLFPYLKQYIFTNFITIGGPKS